MNEFVAFIVRKIINEGNINEKYMSVSPVELMSNHGAPLDLAVKVGTLISLTSFASDLMQMNESESYENFVIAMHEAIDAIENNKFESEYEKGVLESIVKLLRVMLKSYDFYKKFYKL